MPHLFTLWKNRRSLRRTLLTWLLLPLVVLMTVGTLVVYEISMDILEETYDEGLWQIAETATRLSRESLKNSGELQIPAVELELLLEDPSDKVFLSILDENGQLAVGDGKLPIPRPEDVEEDLYYDTRVDGMEVRAIKSSFQTQQDGVTREWTLLAGETRHKREILANDVLLYFLLPQSIIILLAAALVLLGIRRGLHPMDALTQSLAQRSHNDMQALRIPQLPAELQPIVDETNSLLERLKAVFESQKHFAADAAHQLRTPLAGLAAQTDFAREQPNPPQTQHALEQIKQVSVRLNHAVNQLLTLARNEPGADTSVRMFPINLNDLGREVAMDWVERAAPLGIDLGFSGTDSPVMVKGDTGRLKEMLGNLIDNALRYCPRGSSITVRVWCDACIGVEDNGPGIPPEEREQVFERFHRLLGTDAEGSGLGLAIVREIAGIHRATVKVVDGASNAHGGYGVLFKVQFQAAD